MYSGRSSGEGNNMIRSVRWGGLVLAGVVVALASGCTAKYERLLQEREHEIVALKDERSRLEVENRGLRSSEEQARERMKQIQNENERLKAAGMRRTAAAPVAAASGVKDQDLVNLAKQNGLNLVSRAEGVAVVLPSTVTFRSGSATLTDRGKQVLNNVATTLRKKFSSRMLSIEGHTDSASIQKCKFGTNWRLSAERAEAVRQFLGSKGVGKETKVRVVGYGPSVPTASNKESSGREKNRRVELVILNT